MAKRLTTEQKNRIKELTRQQRFTLEQIAEEVNTSVATVKRINKELAKDKPPV